MGNSDKTKNGVFIRSALDYTGIRPDNRQHVEFWTSSVAIPSEQDEQRGKMLNNRKQQVKKRRGYENNKQKTSSGIVQSSIHPSE